MTRNQTPVLDEFNTADWAVTLNGRPITHFTIREGERLVIGRAPDAGVLIDNTAVSRQHSAIELRNGRHFLSDLKSTNGTTVNGVKITAPTPISENDQILIGKFQLIRAQAFDQSQSSSYAKAMDLDEETIFVGSARQTETPPQPSPTGKALYTLRVLSGNAFPKNLTLDGKSSIKIGKDPSCDIVLSGWLLAKTQCYILSKQDRYFIAPQSSWTRIRINDAIISDERPLRKGDIIRIRKTTIRFD